MEITAKIKYSKAEISGYSRNHAAGSFSSSNELTNGSASAVSLLVKIDIPNKILGLRVNAPSFVTQGLSNCLSPSPSLINVS